MISGENQNEVSPILIAPKRRQKAFREGLGIDYECTSGPVACEIYRSFEEQPAYPALPISRVHENFSEQCNAVEPSSLQLDDPQYFARRSFGHLDRTGSDGGQSYRECRHGAINERVVVPRV
jgi:hypothetical protein